MVSFCMGLSFFWFFSDKKPPPGGRRPDMPLRTCKLFAEPPIYGIVWTERSCICSPSCRTDRNRRHVHTCTAVPALDRGRRCPAATVSGPGHSLPAEGNAAAHGKAMGVLPLTGGANRASILYRRDRCQPERNKARRGLPAAGLPRPGGESLTELREIVKLDGNRGVQVPLR